MEYLFIQRPGDREKIMELLIEFKQCSKEELVSRYNRSVELGIVGVHAHEIIHKEHPDIKNIDWLGSVILENGNWICYLDSSQDSKNKIIPNLFYQYMRRFNFDKMKLNPTIVKITDTTLYFKLDNQNELLSFDFNTLFVLSEIRYDFKA